MSYDKKTKRPIEVVMNFHDLAKGEGVSVRQALRRNRMACDRLFVAHVLREATTDEFVTSSYDGATRAQMGAKQLFDVWVALAGHILRTEDDGTDVEIQRLKKFVVVVLGQLRLSAELGRLDTPLPTMPRGVTSAALPTMASVETAAPEGAEVIANAQDVQAMRDEMRRLLPEFDAALSEYRAEHPDETPGEPASPFEVIDAELLDERAVRDPTAS